MSHRHRVGLGSFVAVWALTLASVIGADADPGLRETVVFESGRDGYRSFRIPAVVAAKDGTLLAFCEGRVDGPGDSGDMDVVLKRSTDGGVTWGPLSVVVDLGADTLGNPCPVVDRDSGRIWLPLTSNHGKNSNEQNKLGTGVGSREVHLVHSDDAGRTWSKPRNVTADVKRDDWTWYATGPGCGIQLADGRLVIPCNHRVRGAPARDSISHVMLSDDRGETWKLGGEVPGPKTNECQVVELSDGSLLLNMRSNHGRGCRAISRSDDRGETWNEIAFDETLIDPTCQASLIRLPPQTNGKTRFVFANAASEKRENLTIRLSEDDCATWSASAVIHAGPAAYSSLVAIGPDRIGCLYEQDGYRRIAFATLDVAWLASQVDKTDER